ncbi:SIS domain-containing protein [Chlorobium sp. BLA1]|uniref:SIS domain-containing protein n=1 Tax=Candidatus Chlorobium masyuteum TaxID=2716876 RepID=UPI0014240240|nr:SIS domain-containing protein [Candidatus Chlorobium masyuteum]NHQ59229.1 SIS domain-containing protein [Candidatus Chlorobium masyuteum]
MSTNTTELFACQYLNEAKRIIDQLDHAAIEAMTLQLVKLRERGGRLFLVGVGGGAGHAGHAVNDFRKLAGIESYSPSDNISELTARTNDEGWDTTYSAWMKVSRLSDKDMLFVFSVGGGDLERNISPNIVRAVQYAKEVGASVIGVLGRNGGYAASVADACVIIPTVNADMVTPHTESFQALIWHLLVSDPRLQVMSNKWESNKP